mgnify:CR=1 FL=1
MSDQTETQDGRNLRRAERHQIDQTLRFNIESDQAPSFWTGLARNISSGGLFVNTYNIPEIGSHIEVRFWVPFQKEAFDLRAEVVWARGDDVAADPNDVGFGARFVDIEPETKKVLDAYIKKIETVFHDMD